jgi:hypothetical protein
MKRPIFVQALTAEEHDQLVAGLRSSDAFVSRGFEILLASARGKIAWRIATDLGCDDQTERGAKAAFYARGLACLEVPSSRLRTIHAAFDPARAGQLKALLHSLGVERPSTSISVPNKLPPTWPPYWLA